MSGVGMQLPMVHWMYMYTYDGQQHCSGVALGVLVSFSDAGMGCAHLLVHQCDLRFLYRVLEPMEYAGACFSPCGCTFSFR